MRTFIVVAAVLMLTLSGFPSHPVQADALAASQLEGLVNQARLSQGVGALRIDSRLQSTAQGKINYMLSSGCFLPRCVNEPTAATRANALGYPGGMISELLDTDDATPEGVISYWMIDGSGDRFLLLYSGFTDLGCASAMAGSTPLWVCDLGQDTTSSSPDKAGRTKVR